MIIQENLVKQTVEQIPVVSRQEFLNILRPTDLVVTQLRSHSDIYQKVRSDIMSFIQGGKFVSIKMIYDQNHVVGYGVETGMKKGKNILRIRKINPWIKNYATGILLRIDMTQDQQMKVMQFINKRIGTEYDKKGSVLSLLQRLNSKINPFNSNENEMSKEELEELSVPMFCSNVFAHAFNYANINIKFSYNNKYVWPKDFVLHPNIQKICRFKIS